MSEPKGKIIYLPTAILDRLNELKVPKIPETVDIAAEMTVYGGRLFVEDREDGMTIVFKRRSEVKP